MSEAAEPRLGRPVRLVFALALAAYLATAAWLVWRTSILEPYSDMFAWIGRWSQFQADGDLGRYLWTPHNFHHLVWTFVVLALDIRAFGGDSYFFLGVGVLCLGATAGMLARIAGAAAGPGLRLVGGGGALALSAMGCHVLDATADINTTYLHALVFAVAAILLAEGSPTPSMARRAGALACGVAAGLGSAAGLAVWPAMLIGACRRRDWRWAAALLAAGGVFGLLYLWGDGSLGHPTSAGGLRRAAEATALFVNYLGLPWVRGIPVVGWLVGLAVLLWSVTAIVSRGGRDAAWPERVAVALIVFSLTTAAMAGVARTGLTPPQLVPMRYAAFLIPLHVGLWTLALPHLRRALEERPRRMQGLVVGAAAVMLLHQAVMAVYAVHTDDRSLRMIADFRAGERTLPMLTTIYPDLPAAAALSARMRAQGFYQRELRPDPRPPA